MSLSSTGRIPGGDLRSADRHALGSGGKRSAGSAIFCLFVLILAVIVTRTALWPWAIAVVLGVILALDRKLLLKVDYVLLVTFLCFFIFSSSIAANPGISGFLRKAVAGSEYWWSIGLSQIISNVPATIVLYPFTENFAGLIYGADTAGLVLPDRIPGLGDQLPHLCPGISRQGQGLHQSLHPGQLGLLPDGGDPRLPAVPLALLLKKKRRASGSPEALLLLSLSALLLFEAFLRREHGRYGVVGVETHPAAPAGVFPAAVLRPRLVPAVHVSFIIHLHILFPPFLRAFSFPGLFFFSPLKASSSYTK